MISGCYDELLVDPSLLQSFSEDEWTSIHELPHLGGLHFCIVLVQLFSKLVSLELWSQARFEFATSSGRKTTGKEITPHGDPYCWWSGGILAMVTIFCCTDQTKLEPSVTLLTFFQWYSPELHMVVVKIFTNVPYFPWGSISFPYLAVTVLSVGASNTQFPLAQLHLIRLFLYSSTQVALLQEKEGHPICQGGPYTAASPYCLLSVP